MSSVEESSSLPELDEKDSNTIPVASPKLEQENVEIEKDNVESEKDNVELEKEISEPDGVKVKVEKDSDIEDKDGKEFAAMESDLLDFEDFNVVENPDKNSTEDGKKENSSDSSDKKGVNSGGGEDGACSEGELGDDDLEEGEIKEPSSDTHGSQPARQVCRFFHRGLCFYGSACRFLHLTEKERGNYSMFDSTPRIQSGYPNQHNNMGKRPRSAVPEFVPAPMPFSAEESAWEKGLREAKLLLKQANKRKDEPDFEEKRLNMSLVVNEKNIPLTHSHIDENNGDLSPRREKRMNDRRERNTNFASFKFDGPINSYGPDPYNNERREKDPRDRSKGRKLSDERRFSKGGSRNRRNMGPSHLDVQRRFFDDQYPIFDPWRRSKSPLGNRTSRSGSYSSVSSYSYSSRSLTSCSRSPPSSRSSCRSLRSPSVQQKRKMSPVAETAVSPKVSSNRFGPVKKKPGPRTETRPKITSSSRSRSISRNSSRSRSISMDSVSSASSHNSTVSHSSSGSESLRQHDLKDREKSDLPYQDSAPVDKFKGIVNNLNDKRDLLEEKFDDAPVEMDLRYLIPKLPEKKEPVRLNLAHKNPIKLTLLNKFPQTKVTGFPKDSAVKKPEESLKSNPQGVKRPLSPSESAEPAKQTPVLLPKKSASSRRDELLKQLKAVEDAIARKRAKF